MFDHIGRINDLRPGEFHPFPRLVSGTPLLAHTTHNTHTVEAGAIAPVIRPPGSGDLAANSVICNYSGAQYFVPLACCHTHSLSPIPLNSRRAKTRCLILIAPWLCCPSFSLCTSLFLSFFSSPDQLALLSLVSRNAHRHLPTVPCAVKGACLFFFSPFGALVFIDRLSPFGRSSSRPALSPSSLFRLSLLSQHQSPI